MHKSPGFRIISEKILFPFTFTENPLLSLYVFSQLNAYALKKALIFFSASSHSTPILKSKVSLKEEAQLNLKYTWNILKAEYLA
jgi:hypothetical protein